MGEKREVTFAIHMLLNRMRRLNGRPTRDERGITPMQGRVIGYVKHHEDNVYQRDLESEFQIRRSTASAILQVMERQGLILREPVAHDARLKKLTLTPRAEAFSDRIEKEIARTESVITEGIGEEELGAFFATISKFEENLKKYDAATESAEAEEKTGEEKV
jgi:MarR family transcriptional repressor of mepA